MDLISVGMDSTSRDIERDCAFGGLFQQIINEMKNSSPLWEDLTMKSNKLHACLRSTIQAVSAFLEAFQKIADAATSTKGATKDIGTALTRICLRHKALEAKLKTFTSSIFDCLIIPLQERLEEWKRVTMNLDKEHAKEYKRGRAELKKRSIETLRLHKKVRKMGAHNGGMANPSFGGGSRPSRGGHMSSHGGSDSFQQHSSEGGSRDLHRILEIAVKDTNEKRQEFEEMEKQAIRTALIEERSRFCLFVSFFKPVVDEEIEMLSELTHVQEAMQQLEKHSADPFSLPASSEQVIADLKGSDNGAWFQTPPSSPSSLGSRKSSLCSISSANSSSSGSIHSPPHNFQHRNQYMSHTNKVAQKIENQSEESDPGSSNSSTPSLTYAPGTVPGTNAAWPNIQDSLQFERAACAIMNERPHTISAAYERNQERPPLTMYTYQAQTTHSTSHPASPHSSTPATPMAEASHPQGLMYQNASEIYGALRGRNESKPPVPKRASSLERVPSEFASEPAPPPKFPSKSRKPSKNNTATADSGRDKTIPALPDFNQSSEDMIVPQPVYVNMHELNQMAAARRLRQHELPPPPPELMNSNMGKRVQDQGALQDSVYGDGINTQRMIGIGEREAATEPAAEACQAPCQGAVPAGLQQSRSQEEKPQPPRRQASSLSTSPVRSYPSLSSPTLAMSPFQQALYIQQTNNTGWNSDTSASTVVANFNSGVNFGPQPSGEPQSPHPREVRSNSLDDALKHISVAETIKTLTEKNHQPVSPNMSMVRRCHSLKQAEEKGAAQQQQQQQQRSANNFPGAREKEKEKASHSQGQGQKGPTQPTPASTQHHRSPGEHHQQQQQSYLNQLYQQMSGQHQQQQPAYQTIASQSASNTPRQTRRFSEELLKTTASFVQNHVLGNRTPPPAVSSKEMFVQTLNAKLSQMRASPPTERRLSSPTLKTSLASKLVASVAHHHGLKGGEMSTAFRVRQWIASKTISDPNLCRESLMDQIRHYDGRRLRHIRAINDRSAPRIR